ncbi:hypothetical protein GWI33_006443 [Rhynchophorus ferrugineus]|uniref:Uncharacterized protein n=1 Tax=Rhynchophorus ferrugineus TaxID=354439 RepID=A0A834ILU5_RHYFE|nr:hypothetical protein GWI33_006443 [Rhynchophorus ferrugineus]
MLTPGQKPSPPPVHPVLPGRILVSIVTKNQLSRRRRRPQTGAADWPGAERFLLPVRRPLATPNRGVVAPISQPIC